MNTRGKFAIGVAIILGTIAWLGWVGATQSKTYYHTISELQTLNGAKRNQRMRVSGNVLAGSIQHRDGRVDFVLEEQGKQLNVSYVGRDPLPDTFKDGAQALVEGRDMADGRFVAEQVQAKCASKYAPTLPKQTSLTSPGGTAPHSTGDAPSAPMQARVDTSGS